MNAFDIDPFVECLVGGGCRTGACCLPDGCEVRTQAACMAAGGVLWLEGEGCEPDPRPPPELPGMALIPAGEFMMGDTFGEGSTEELPVHAVYVDAFYMAVYTVTNAEYAARLNWAWTQGGLITVTDGVVYQVGSGTSFPYCTTTSAPSGWPEWAEWSRITWDGSTFGVVVGKENHPMVMVSWYGAVAYCNWRSAMKGRPLCYDRMHEDPPNWDCNFSGTGYRLPTEAEWEKAARGGTPGQRFPWGDTIQHARANYYSRDVYSYDTSATREHHPLWGIGSKPYTSPVGFFDGSLQYKTDWGWPGDATSYQTASGVNGYGLYDMAGNLDEWCNDRWSSTYYSTSPYDNPTGPASGTGRVKRGGYRSNWAWYCRCAYRNNSPPAERFDQSGFRLALDSP